MVKYIYLALISIILISTAAEANNDIGYKFYEKGNYKRDLSCCKIIGNTIYKANFFPKKSYLLKINGKGFGRHQIRLIMGALIKLGKGEIDLDYISKSLLVNSSKTMDYIAPASGLILHRVKF